MSQPSPRGIAVVEARISRKGRNLLTVDATTTDASRLELLIEAGAAIASGLELDDLLARLVELACKLTEARYGALGVIDDSGRRLDHFITYGMDQLTRDGIGPEPVGRGILGALIIDARPLRLTDLGADPRSTGFPPNHPPMRTFLGVPIAAGGRVFGNLYLTEKTGGEFTEADERLMQMFSAHAGAAIQNTRVLAESREHAFALERAMTELSSVRRINEAILSGQPQTEILELIASQAAVTVHARLVMIGLVDPGAECIRIEAASGHGTEAFRQLEIRLKARSADWRCAPDERSESTTPNPTLSIRHRWQRSPAAERC